MSETSHRVADFLAATGTLFIGGKHRDALSGRTFSTPNPATGETLATVAEGGAEDIDLAVTAARAAYDDGPWRTLTPSQRGKILWRIGDLIESHAEELAEIESLDNGKPRLQAQFADVAVSAELFHYMAGWATKIDGDTLTLSTPYAPGAQFHAYTLREPLGVVGQIIPWNFPLMMAAWKLAPALATGNTVVLKLAEQTPLSALYLADLLVEAGLPDGVVNIVPGFGETAGAALAAHPAVDKIAFTGSTEVGKLILRAAEGNLKKVTLELGGKAPNVVFADADIDAAIKGAADAIFFNQGQVCCAGSASTSRATLSTTSWQACPRSPAPSRSATAATRTPRWGRWSPPSSSSACPATSSPACRTGRARRPAVRHPAGRATTTRRPC